jgi:hypothetical protein
MLRDFFDFLYVGLYTGMMDLIFFFSILTFNIRFIGNGAS